MNNLFANIPAQLPGEIFEDLINHNGFRIERIFSHGQSSPADHWYDQPESEWVVVLTGQGVIEFEDGSQVTLNVGDHLNIPAHQKHRVASTAANETTIWLAVFYQTRGNQRHPTDVTL
uniref:cupin domain-containing protein n=1 Tax=Thaumasiovibrio occultus TaxID=1891184 RepID=UPI000B364783|nr:cupin domain-containing protein [Thaumasiovibrio occultus]